MISESPTRTRSLNPKHLVNTSVFSDASGIDDVSIEKNGRAVVATE